MQRAAVVSSVKFICFTSIVIFVFVPLAIALAVSPGRTILQYQPGTLLEGSFSLSADHDVPIVLRVDGPLAPYLSLAETSLTLKAGESRTISYTVQLPDVLPTEKLESLIVAKDVSNMGQESGTFVGVRLAVATKIDIQLPATATIREPQQASEGTLEVRELSSDVAANELAGIDVELFNKGGSTVREVFAELLVFDIDNDELVHSSSERYTIDPQTKVKARIGFDASRLAPGMYRAKLIVKSAAGVVEREFMLRTRERSEPTEAATTQETSPTRKAMDVAIVVGFIIVANVLFWFFYYLRRKHH